MESDIEKEQFKRQASEFIFSIYLQRENDEDIKFIRDNVKSTAEFAKNVGSSIKSGLKEVAVEKNRLMYGRNLKKTVRTFSKLKEELFVADPENRVSQIFHLNTVDQKIFASLSRSGPRNFKQQKINPINPPQRIQQFQSQINPIQEENFSNLSLNRVTPFEEEEGFKQSTKSRFGRKQLAVSEKRSQTHEDSLKGYLSEFCRFKTQKIVQEIVQLAKHQSTTYYYQKYTTHRLKGIPFVYSNGCELEMSKQRFEKTKRLARSIRVVEGLTPFLGGQCIAAYSESRMSVMVGVIGVRINYENGVVRRMKELEAMGVRTVVLVRGREEDEKETTKDERDGKGLLSYAVQNYQ